MKKPSTTLELEMFGRERLSKHFFMRDFLYSDIASIHGFNNVPDNPDLAIEVGKKLCGELLEPLEERFGRVAIRSAFRSSEVNGFGNAMQLAKRKGYTCASKDKNFGHHIWDVPDKRGALGATACIVIPSFWDQFQDDGDWKILAWWVHDNLPYSEMEFYGLEKRWAFNLTWSEQPERSIYSYPGGYLTRPGKENHVGSHEKLWSGIEKAFR